MNDPLTALLNVIPPQYKGWVIFLALVFPYVTRGLHALATGRGLVGSCSAVLFGTNTPRDVAPSPSPVKINMSLLIGLLCLAAFLVGCGSLARNVYQAEVLAADTTQGARHTFNVWYAPERSKAVETGDTNRVLELDNMRDYVRLQVNRVGVTLRTVDDIRLEVSTNSASTNLSALQLAADALPLASSNLTWAVKYFMSGRLTAARTH